MNNVALTDQRYTTVMLSQKLIFEFLKQKDYMVVAGESVVTYEGMVQ